VWSYVDFALQKVGYLGAMLMQMNSLCAFSKLQFSYLWYIHYNNLGLELQHSYAISLTITFFFKCFHMVSNNSSLFMSMLNLIWININIMDMKRHMLICLFVFHIHVGEKRKKDEVVIKMDVVIKGKVR